MQTKEQPTDDRKEKRKRFDREARKGIYLSILPMFLILLFIAFFMGAIIRPVVGDSIPAGAFLWLMTYPLMLCLLAAGNVFPYIKYKDTTDEYERSLLQGNLRTAAICAAGFTLWTIADIVLMGYSIYVPDPENAIIGLASPAAIYLVLYVRNRYKNSGKKEWNPAGSLTRNVK